MKIAVLHARQPLTTSLAEVFHGDECLLLTAGDAAAVREDVDGEQPRTITAGRGDWPAVLAAFGPDEVVTNDEYCLAECARLRAVLGMAARHPAYPSRYLDKVAMKRELAAAGIRVPRVHVCEPVTGADEAVILEHVGLPAVAKPRQEANSRGVRVLNTVAELREWLTVRAGAPGWQVEEFVAGTGHHINALVRDEQVEPVQVGRYFGPLLDLPTGRRLGSVSVADPRLHELNARVVAALGGQGAFVVHTELIVTAAGEPVVIEVAARAPGGDVPRMAQLHAGVELEAANLRMQAGLPVVAPRPTGVDAAWLWVPVLPGERYRRTPDLRSEHEVQVRRVGREGNDGASGVVGLSAVLWNADPAQLAADVDVALAAQWFG